MNTHPSLLQENISALAELMGCDRVVLVTVDDRLIHYWSQSEAWCRREEDGEVVEAAYKDIIDAIAIARREHLLIECLRPGQLGRIR
jgi:mannose-1-phosphate guanylyltransferase